MLSAVGRTLMVTLIPLQAHALLGDAQKVSVLYFAVSFVNLFGSLSIPWLVRTLRRRRVFSLGAIAIAVAPLLLGVGDLETLIAGMLLQVFGLACLDISLNLYLMDHIPRQEMGRFEPQRLFYGASVWAIGPWLGVYLQGHLGEWVPYAVATAAALVTLGVFWFLRLTENPAVAPAKGPPPSPFQYLPRFFAQPRLRLAWILAIGRAGWWSMFFVFGPIYLVSVGLDKVTAGAVISVGSSDGP